MSIHPTLYISREIHFAFFLFHWIYQIFDVVFADEQKMLTYICRCTFKAKVFRLMLSGKSFNRREN